MRCLTLFLLFCLGCFRVEGSELPPCDELEVRYSAPEIMPLSNRVTIQPLASRPTSVLADKDPEFKPHSPHATAAFNRVRIPDFTKSDPYITSIQVFSLSGEPHAWQLNFIDHGNNNVEIRWLNEELLFLRVWWGRIVSTDLIFQLSTGSFIYAREANYGQLVEPCK